MRDVLVVGAGPVGSFLTALLLDAGLDAVAVDAREEGAAHSRAIGIHPPSLALLDRVGVAAPLLAAGVQIRQGVARSRGADLGALRFAADGEAPIVALAQPVTQALLDAAVHARRPDGIRRGVRVSGARGTSGAVILCGEAASGPWQEEARFVVGADGAGSTLRRLTGTTWQVRPYRDGYVMADFRDDTGDGSLAVLHLEREGIVESFPLPGGLRRWVAYCRQPLEGPDHLAALIARRTGSGPDPATASMFSSFVPRRAIVSAMSGDRLALVGDAAHEISPIGGQGMNLGWADAAHLARILPGVLGSAGGGDALRAFSRSRLSVARRAARQAEFNMLLGRPAPGALQAGRKFFARLATRPPLGRHLARAFTMAGL